jgi:IclR family mhp operon transcriptional activator
MVCHGADPGALARRAALRHDAGMATKLENRSLDRGIQILEVLTRDGPCSLHQLHQKTQLPKSTIRRLVGTLTKRHFLRKGISDGLFRANVSLPWSSSLDLPAVSARLLEAALPHMICLTRSVGWPSDLHIRRRDRMRIVESTRPLSPFRLYRGRVDFEVNMFGAAAGLASLATLDDAQVGQVFDTLRHDRQWGPARFALSERTLISELAQVRARGYAPRRDGYLGESVADDKLQAIAVPIVDNGVAVGGLSILWLRSYLSADAFADSHLAALTAAAAAISADLAKSHVVP